MLKNVVEKRLQEERGGLGKLRKEHLGIRRFCLFLDAIKS